MLPKNIELILGSSSPFRAAILNQVGLQYEIVVPDIDETQHPNELPLAYVARLAQEKADAVAKKLPAGKPYLIIASDQTAADQDGIIYGKPETAENAVTMLRSLSGRTIHYHCAVALYSTATHKIYTDISTTTLKFKKLEDRLIYQYLSCEPQAIACASGLRIESCGVMLVESFSSTDPTSCQGIPLLTLDKLLARHGFSFADFIFQKEYAY